MDPELHGRIDDVDPLDHKRLKNVGDMHQSKTIMILSQNKEKKSERKEGEEEREDREKRGTRRGTGTKNAKKVAKVTISIDVFIY